MAFDSKAFKRALELSEAPRRKRKKTKGGFLQHVDVADFLETLGVERLHKATRDEYSFSCPFAGHTSGDANPSAYMNDGSLDKSKTTMWKCHGCGRSGNGVAFYAELQGISKQEAIMHIQQTWAPNFRAPKGGSISAEFEDRMVQKWESEHEIEHIKTIEWSHYDKLFGVDWEDAHQQYKHPDCDYIVSYLFDRGFTVQSLQAWRIGYDDHTNRITIPVCNIDGELVGVKGRLPHDDARPKYLVLGDRPLRRPHYGFMTYEKSLVVFGLDRVKDVGKLVLVEGELDVIALWQVGIPAISTGSAHLSDDQAKLIRDCVDELITFFDSNTAGEQATWGYEDKNGEWHPGLVSKLEPFMRLRVVEDHPDDAAKLLQLGQKDEIFRLIEQAPSHLRYFLL